MKKLFILLALLFVGVLFFSCAPDMSGKFEGSWIYSTGSSNLKYTFEGNTFKLDYDEGSGYVETFNGTFKALGDKLSLHIEKVNSDALKEMVDMDLEINTAFGINDTNLMFMNNFEGGMPFVFVGGNTSTLEGKWNMPFGYKTTSGFKIIVEVVFDISFEIKSDGTFIASQEIPKETVYGKWAVELQDKLILSECEYIPSNNSLKQFFENSDYRFSTVGNALGFVKGYGTGYEVKIYTKEN